MAASGLVEYAEAASMELAMNHKVPRVQLVKLKGIFHGPFEKNGVRNGSDIAKCLEQLTGVLPNSSIQIKTPLGRNFSVFGKETYTNRLGRSPSSDSIAVSTFSSDQGSVDSCHYSSTGSDSNSGSSPCSPEELDRSSRAGSPQSMPPTSPPLPYDFQEEEQLLKCQKDSSKNSSFEEKKRLFFEQQPLTGSNAEDVKPFYLQQQTDCSVPNSESCEPFQSLQNHVPPQTLEKTVVPEPRRDLTPPQTSFKCDSASSRSTATNQSNCSSSASDLQQCHWAHCTSCLEGNTELVEHIRSQHVQVQKDKETFTCLWIGCKVYNRPSCSLSWLERHVLSHGGSKPFKCIVDNCTQRFQSQAALQRHVNSHFDSHANNHGGKTGRCRDEVSAKNLRRKKHPKYKKRSVVGKTEDFFDANIMEQIRYKLVEFHSSLPLGSTNGTGSITFHSRVKAIKKDKSGEVKVLLHWIPENILPDNWVSEKSVTKCKKVPYSSLPPETRASLHPHLDRDSCDDAPRVKQRRK